MTTFLDTNVGGHLEVTIFERVDLNLNVAAFHDTKHQMLSGMWNTICYVVFSVTRWHAICNAARWEKYQLKEDRWSALKRKKTVWAGNLSIGTKMPFISRRVRHSPHALSFHCRVGYLSLFGGEQNNNRTDPSSVYEEYKKFDGLLTKLARGTLKAGNVAGDKLPALIINVRCRSSALQAMSHETVSLQLTHVTVSWHHSRCFLVAMASFTHSIAYIASRSLFVVFIDFLDSQFIIAVFQRLWSHMYR